MHIHALQLLFEFNEMLKQTVSEVVATNWHMVCCKLLQVPAKLPFTFAEVSWSNT